MKEIIGLLVLAGGLLIAALGLLFYGIATRRRRVSYLVLASLLLGLGVAGWAAYRVSYKTYRHVAEAVRPRTGEEIYAALFGRARPGCLRVIHHQDQLVPRLDCCIWLEFRACPAEIKRILAHDTAFRPVSQPVPPLLPDTANYSPKPTWWRPGRLGRAALLRQKFQPSNPNRDQLLIFSSDSTHAYYCDMAD